jgi:hypothetical protein
MNCSNCRWPLPDDDLYCHRCGVDNSPPQTGGQHECVLEFKGITVPAPIQEAFQLLGNEKAVGLWRCVMIDEARRASSLAPPVNGINLSVIFSNDNGRVEGLLIITNRRLVLLRESFRLKGMTYTNERVYSLAYIFDIRSMLALEEREGKVGIRVKT